MMGDAGEYWNDHRQHERDVDAGIVRCVECGEPSEPSCRTPLLRYCRKCRRTFNTPKWALDQERRA